jgi:hypothetical protein
MTQPLAFDFEIETLEEGTRGFASSRSEIVNSLPFQVGKRTPGCQPAFRVGTT